MKRSLYDSLPPNIQTHIDALIKESGFADYTGTTDRINDFLNANGYEIKFYRSTVHRHGSKLK
ncbi:MAG: hypothetical protein WCQ26_13480, partial [Pseudanabaena sp. ELA748]